MQLKPNTEIVKATNEYDRELDVHVESYSVGGEVWIGVDDPYGVPRCIIVADSFEAAYYELIDSLPTIDDSDLHEAYDVETREEFDAAVEAARAGTGDWPELCDGYMHQGSASGTGIVDTMYANIYPYNKDSGINLQIERY
jgi:hypothetical protein